MGRKSIFDRNRFVSGIEIVSAEKQNNKKDNKNGNKKINKSRIITIVLLCIFIAIFAFSLFKIISTLSVQKESTDFIEEVQEEAFAVEDDTEEVMTEENSDETESAEVTATPKKEYVDGSKVKINFDSLLKQNGDVKAWIYLEGTNINYPIAQGKDNDQYIHTLLNGKYNAAGTLFIDYSNKADFSENVTVIYGHNMHSGIMFHALLNYKKQSFYNEHPYMYIYTPTQNYRLYVYAACVTTNVSDVYYLPQNEKDFESYINIFKKNNMIKTDVTPTYGDNLVMLSTCSYDVTDGRFVVLGKLVPFD